MGKIMGKNRFLAVLVAIMLFAPMGQFAAADDLATPGVDTPDPVVEGEDEGRRPRPRIPGRRRGIQLQFSRAATDDASDPEPASCHRRFVR